MITTFLCLALAIDGDTLSCRNGPHVRIAGIEANELHGGCHLASCPAMPGPEARDTMAAMVDGKTLRCLPLGRSYRRIVASCRLPDGRELRCALLAPGAAVRWQAYERRYGLGACER